MPRVSRAAWDHAGPDSTGTPRAANTSALPLRLDTERLPCLTTGTPAAATTRAVAVLMLNVPEPSPPAPQVSRTGRAGQLSRCIAPRSRVTALASSDADSPLQRSAVNQAAASASSK